MDFNVKKSDADWKKELTEGRISSFTPGGNRTPLYRGVQSFFRNGYLSLCRL